MIEIRRRGNKIEFRTIVWYVDASGAMNVTGDPQWTDWQEVPRVKPNDPENPEEPEVEFLPPSEVNADASIRLGSHGWAHFNIENQMVLLDFGEDRTVSATFEKLGKELSAAYSRGDFFHA